MHSIVDSLWLRRVEPAAADAERLATLVERATGVRFEPQGRYHWIVFLPTRAHQARGVARIGASNRFYGLFDKEPDSLTRSQQGQDVDYIADGRLKVRGVELRQGSAPGVVVRACDSVRFVVTDAKSRDPEARVREARLIEGERHVAYDADAYETLVVRALASILLPLGYDEARVAEEMGDGPRQAVVEAWSDQ